MLNVEDRLGNGQFPSRRQWGSWPWAPACLFSEGKGASAWRLDKKPTVPIPHFNDAYQTQRVLEAALLLAKLKKPVELKDVR